MTSTATISIPCSHAGDLSRLFELEQSGVLPRDALTYYPDPPRYVVDLDSAHVTYLLEQLIISADTRGGQSYVEWLAANSEQLSLPLNSPDGVF